MANSLKWCSLWMVALILPSLVPASVINWSRLGEAASTILRFKPRQKQQESQTVNNPETGKPAFCNDLDCPAFTVVKNESTYQLREYVLSNWVSTTSVGIDYKQASYADFMLLFDYIDGYNVKKEKIKMTAPVLNRIIPGQGPACENNFTMSFFMAPSVTNPPQPSDNKVFFSKLPKMRVYVRSFPGFARNVSVWIEEASKLAMDLKGKGEHIKEFYYTAGYNSPFQLTDRHNEVWFIAK